MDFIRVAHKEDKEGNKTFYPSLQAIESTDVVLRGGQFVAIWDEDTGLYSRKQSHIASIIDRSFSKMVGDKARAGDTIKKIRVYDNQIYSRLTGMFRNIGDMGPELDQRIVFANEVPVKGHAATFKMPYALSDAPCPVWNEIVSTLYSPEERLKIEWAIGSIFTGSSVDEVQKFYVFFGPPGSGKSTILDIIEMLFDGHTAQFDALELGRRDSGFPLEPFKNNPLVAVDQDADLSHVETNQQLNKLIAHDKLNINSKGKNLYEIKPRSTLFVGTNSPVKITDKKSGLYRRLVDIQPSGNLIPEEHYHNLIRQVRFELGSIATHCINVFEDLGRTYLSQYRATDMMYRTNDIFNFVQDHRMVLEKGLTLKQAHKMYLEWCAETETKNIYKQFQFRDLLADYFKEFHDQVMIDGQRYRSYFEGLRELEQFSWSGTVPVPPREWLSLDETESILDVVLMNEKAQYAQVNNLDYPLKQSWEKTTQTLSDLDTSKEHYVKVPKQHIVIDLDLKDEHGKKDLKLNLAAAALWPPTYAEVSRGGNALHLHYDYEGDVERIAAVDPDGKFEVKTLLGNASLRRRLQFCNNHEVARISSGLPFKKEESVISPKVMSNEKNMRELILRALRKEINVGTKTNMDFIEKVLNDAYLQGMAYDVTDMWDEILSFAMGSSNQASKCMEIALGLKLKSEIEMSEVTVDTDKPKAILDSEVYPNLFTIGWIYEDAPDDQYVEMVNPSPQEVQELFDRLRLIGYNARSYDAHIMWGRTMGMDNRALYELSQRIITENDHRAKFGAAYNAFYADPYDYMSEKHSQKWWQIKMGLPHKEMDLPWDQDVPEDRVQDVLDYMRNDVLSLRAIVKDRAADFRAREILAELSGLEVINTNRQHTEKLIFKGERDVSNDLVYTDLHEMFPGYKFDRFASGKDKSTYKGEAVGEGGLVRAIPGMYENVALLDVASMHPTSIIELNLFGKYTDNFKELMDVRLLIKKGRLEEAGQAFGGRLAKYVSDPKEAKMLSDALKIVINSVYGLTAASFPNLFRDPRNVDNIVAKRGALFMMDLKEMVEAEGFQVVHIKTDSLKIVDPNEDILDKVSNMGKQYGYDFEHEATYDKFCLVNDAVYVAGVIDQDGPPWDDPDNPQKIKWSATGKQFQHPVVFKTLFSGEDIVVTDYVETKQVSKGAMYLMRLETEHKQFIGKFGAFVPVHDGRILLRIDGDKEHSVSDTKGFLWEVDDVALAESKDIDMSYFQEKIDEGLKTIAKFGSYEEFVKP